MAMGQWQGIGNQQIDDFLANRNRTISDSITKAIRDHQDLLPRAATTTRELALHCLGTNRGNRWCVYHHVSKSGKIFDGSKDAKFAITGVPLSRKLTPKKGETLRRGGHLNCGCSEDMALLDFYFWKTWKVKKGNVEEGLKNQRIEPRLRLFFAENYTTDSTLTVDDLYTRGKPDNVAKKIRIRQQIKRLSKRLNALNKADGEALERLDAGK